MRSDFTSKMKATKDHRNVCPIAISRSDIEDKQRRLLSQAFLKDISGVPRKLYRVKNKSDLDNALQEFLPVGKEAPPMIRRVAKGCPALVRLEDITVNEGESQILLIPKSKTKEQLCEKEGGVEDNSVRMAQKKKVRW